MNRHFTSSVYVFDPETTKFLFVKHKKLGKWLQPGGHWEPNELPDESAIREVQEETGFQIRLIGDRLPRESDQTRPFAIQRNVLADSEHEHLDLVYLAVPKSGVLTQNITESDGIGWFDAEEICGDKFDTFEPQKYWVKFFTDLMTEKK